MARQEFSLSIIRSCAADVFELCKAVQKLFAICALVKDSFARDSIPFSRKFGASKQTSRSCQIFLNLLRSWSVVNKPKCRRKTKLTASVVSLLILSPLSTSLTSKAKMSSFEAKAAMVLAASARGAMVPKQELKINKCKEQVLNTRANTH